MCLESVVHEAYDCGRDEEFHVSKPSEYNNSRLAAVAATDVDGPRFLNWTGHRTDNT